MPAHAHASFPPALQCTPIPQHVLYLCVGGGRRAGGRAVQEDNETPTRIAREFGCAAVDIVRLNATRYPGIRGTSKLRQGTTVSLPLDAVPSPAAPAAESPAESPTAAAAHTATPTAPTGQDAGQRHRRTAGSQSGAPGARGAGLPGVQQDRAAAANGVAADVGPTAGNTARASAESSAPVPVRTPSPSAVQAITATLPAPAPALQQSQPASSSPSPAPRPAAAVDDSAVVAVGRSMDESLAAADDLAVVAPAGSAFRPFRGRQGNSIVME